MANALMDRLDEALIVGLAETTQDLAGFPWTNAAYCSMPPEAEGFVGFCANG